MHFRNEYDTIPLYELFTGFNPLPYFPQSWWRHQMETFSALLAICAWNSSAPGEFPSQRPVTRSFDVFFDLRLNKRLSKQSWGWWFETQTRPLWRQCNDHWHVKKNTRFKSQVFFWPCTLSWYSTTMPIINRGTKGNVLAKTPACKSCSCTSPCKFPQLWTNQCRIWEKTCVGICHPSILWTHLTCGSIFFITLLIYMHFCFREYLIVS